MNADFPIAMQTVTQCFDKMICRQSMKKHFIVVILRVGVAMLFVDSELLQEHGEVC